MYSAGLNLTRKTTMDYTWAVSKSSKTKNSQSPSDSKGKVRLMYTRPSSQRNGARTRRNRWPGTVPKCPGSLPHARFGEVPIASVTFATKQVCSQARALWCPDRLLELTAVLLTVVVARNSASFDRIRFLLLEQTKHNHGADPFFRRCGWFDGVWPRCHAARHACALCCVCLRQKKAPCVMCIVLRTGLCK